MEIEKGYRIAPLGHQVLVKKLTADRSKGGIIIPDNAKGKNPTEKARVVEVGEGWHDKAGNLHPLTLKKGAITIVPRYSGIEVQINGDEHVILPAGECLATIEEVK